MSMSRWYACASAAFAALHITAAAHAQSSDPVCLAWGVFGIAEDVVGQQKEQVMICSEDGQTVDATLIGQYVGGDEVVVSFRTRSIPACGSDGYCIAQKGQQQYTLGPNDFRTMGSPVDQVWLLSCYCN